MDNHLPCKRRLFQIEDDGSWIPGEDDVADNTTYVCFTCESVLDSKDDKRSDHPWEYGHICSGCLSDCRRISFKWFGSMGLRCGECTTTNKRLLVYKNRLLCVDCIDTNADTTCRHDWREKVIQLHFHSAVNFGGRKPLRVLSTFDGIGTGLIGLEKNGLKVQEYMSCEIDDSALAVLNFRFSGRITHLGSVSNLSPSRLKSLGHIDLLLGGSPCNEFSRANPLRAGPFEADKTGVLFFDFYRILMLLQAASARSGRPLFWLYENVASMPLNFRDTISKYLKCQPASWNAIHFLPAKRVRLFWGNIPELQMVPPSDQTPVSLDSILEPHRRGLVKVLPTITTTFHSQTTGKGMQLPVIDDGNEDGLLITERERLFGFPSHFTDGPDLSVSQRQALLGRAWSVPVIAKILAPLTKLYETIDHDDVKQEIET